MFSIIASQAPLRASFLLQARVGDGLEAVSERASSQGPPLDILIVDASGGDPSQAMTCPPAAFLERGFLETAHRSLSAEGLLVMNCVCRSESVFDSAVSALQVDCFLHMLKDHIHGLKQIY